MADEGKNIRSVIKNATQWGLSSRLWGAGDTIATKEEINKNKEKPETPKMSVWPKLGLQTPSLGWLNGWLNLKKAQSTEKSEVVSQPKVEQWGQSMAGWVSVSQQPPVSSPFQNQMNEPLNNINVEQFNNESILRRPTELNLRMAEKPITARLKELDKEKNKRMSKGIENLYIDAYNKWVDGWMLTIEDVLGNKNYQQQLKGIDEKMLAEMIDDANYLAQWDYDTQNVLALMDKYKDLWLKMDLDNLPPETKAQYIAANLEGNDGGLWGVLDHISPLNIPGEFAEMITGKNPRDYNEKLQQWAEEGKHDFLSDEELKYVTQDFVKNLDKEYKDYYYNQTEEMFTDRKVGEQFYKDVAKLRKENKDMSEEEAVAKVMKEWKYNGVSYEKLPHETVDQWRFWNDKDKEKEYKKRLKELEGKVKEAHWDTTANWFKNLWLDATLVVGQGLDLVRNPWSLISWLASAVKGVWHKAIEWYADLLDTWIATTESAIGAIQGKNEWNGIEYRVGDIGEKVAKRKGYEDYDDMVQKMEQASEDNPWLKVATWFLKQGKKDLGTANAFGDYLTNAYGSWDRVEQTAKENPVQMASDIISIIQLGTMWAAKMWLIDANKANQIIKVAWYGDLYEQTLKWGNKAQFWPVLRGEMAVAKAWAKVVWVPFKVAKNFTEVFVNKLSWITKEERDFIKQNPEKVEEFLKWDKNSQSLLDKIIERFDGLQLEKKLEGEEYEKIKNSNAPVKISDMLSSISNRLKKGGLELTNEGVKVNKNYTPAINNKFTELGAFLDELRKKWNSATAEDVRWARRQIDTLAKWEGQPAGLEADAIGLIRDIRGILDAELKRQIPDMKVLDDSYKKTIEEVKEMKKDWFNKDGTLKDSAYSKIRNLTNKGSNQPKLARLEKLLPWITEELKGLAVAESVEKAGKQMVGQYANQIFGVGGWIVGITSLLSGWLSAWPIILWVLWATLATPKNLVKLLKYQGKISNGFNKIISKITNGIKLTPAETQEFTKYLNDNQRELGKDARYMYEKGLITDEEYKMALKNEEKEVKMTWKEEKNEYNNKDNLDINQKNKDGVIEESKNDTWKGEKNLWWLAKKEKGVEQWWVWQKTSWQAWNDGWRVSQEDWGYLEINTDWAKVVENLEKIKASNPDWFKMDIHWEEDYGNWKRKTFQSKDGLSSVTVKEDGDITSLVSKPWLKRGKELVLTAIKNWGDKLDCYEEYLPTMYQNWGFEPVARVKFNPEYAPADWKGKGQDIIVMMRRNNDSVEKVNENWWRYEKVDLDDLPVMEYDDALAYRDMLLEERKKSYKPRKVETVQETSKGLKKKKEWVAPNKPIWEETINKDTWKPYTAEEVDAKMNKIKDKYLNDKNKLRKLYNQYVEINDELDKDLQNTFMKDGYLNPDGLRPLINKEFAKEMWVGDNVMASTNHPAVSKIADAFVEMVGDDMIEKASKWEKVNVALIWGWGWSWKSGWPKAMISEGFVKDGEKVNMTLDVQGGANDLKKLIEKAREKWVLDKFNFKIAYVYASTEDAGKGVINRTINQNQRILEKQWLSPKVVEKETDIGKNRLYAWRTLPFEVFEQGHLKSVWEKWLRGYIDIAKDIDNVEFMITERIPWDKKNTNKYIVKQGWEWKMTEKELNDLVTRMTKNKEAWLNWAELEKEWQKAVKEGKISKRQYANLFGRLWAFAFLLMVVGWWNGEEA